MGQESAKGSTKFQELALELRVEHAMTRDLVTVSPDRTMAEFMEVLRAKRISGAPVVEEERMVGIVSIEDLVRALADGELTATVRERMTPDPVTLCGDERLVHAMAKFSQLRFGRFPVIDREGALVGIITQGDIARAMLRRLEVDCREEEIHRYHASHIFGDIIADEAALVLKYDVVGQDFSRAGEAASGLRRTLTLLGVHPQVIRRVAVATFEAEMNIVVFTEGGGIVVEVCPDRIAIEALDGGPGIPDIDRAMEPGFSTAPLWVQEMGFGAGMGLPNIKACSDEMTLESTVGKGTHLTAIIYSDESRISNQ